ncbi:MAG TPA: alpha/beta hydrolase-fold protein [Thermoanaerobaculia bacterium]|jgi:phospholipase/carboxylesterase|nr:alpha/beta hydrolase-fold protein [Thermoanaerobaculia bacterium]
MNLLYTSHVPAGDGPFPAVIALHGWGASAHDLLGLAPMLHGGRALVLCPQGPVAVPFGGGQYGYGWFPLRPGEPIDADSFRRASEALREFVGRALDRYPIDREKVVVAGFSQGGVMAYDLALREPARFAGLAALSSWLPALLVEDLPKLPEHQGFPVLVMHGTRDDRIEVERARESREALRAFGVAITYREFEMGHEIRQDALGVLLQWLEEKVLKGD